MDDSLRPAAFLRTLTVKFIRLSSGSGPLARPPKVFSGAPAGRTLLRSHFGICPIQSKPRSSLYAFAQPSLLSETVMTVSDG